MRIPVLSVLVLLPVLVATTVAGGDDRLTPAPGPQADARGATIYNTYCVGCHMPAGQGMAPAIPKLKGNDNLRDAAHVVRMLHTGRGAMPPFKHLKPEEMAAVATHVRTSFGNSYGAVTVAQVKAALSPPKPASAKPAPTRPAPSKAPAKGAAPRSRPSNAPAKAPAAAPATDSAGWFTAEQAARGKPLYEQHCGKCHGTNFVPDDFATGLKGAAFDWRWKERTVYDFYETTRTTMPPGEGGTIGPRTTADIVAYILQVNGFAPGSSELPADPAKLQQMPLRRTGSR